MFACFLLACLHPVNGNIHEIQIMFLYETVMHAYWKFNCQSIYLLLYYTVIIYRLSTVAL